MIVTNRLLSSSNFSHHSVALANVETYVSQARPIVAHYGLDENAIIVKAQGAAFKGILSSAEAEALLGQAAPCFFRWLSEPGARQQHLLNSALRNASKTNTRVER